MYLSCPIHTKWSRPVGFRHARDMAKKVRVRDQIADLPAYVPGARGDGTMRDKLSSNENPFPPLPRVLAAVADAAADLNRYPDMYASELAEALARVHDVEPDQVVIGNGSVALVEIILKAICEPGDEVVYPWRSFEAYPITIAVAGATGTPIPLTEQGRHDIPAMIAALTDRTKAIVLCSPNNPTGPALTEAELQRVLDEVPPHVLVLLDEAYVEFIRASDAADGMRVVADSPNLVVLRTFSKAYGLAGLRVGYAVGRSKLMAGIRAASTPFGVNGLAQAAALESLRARDELLGHVSEIVQERDRVVQLLTDQGWQIPDAQGNFVWFDVGAHAGALADAFAQGGILVRPFAGDGVRVTIGDRASNDVVIEVAGAFREAHVR